MANVFREPLIVTKPDRPESYPIDLRGPQPVAAPIVLVTAPPPPVLWAASQL